LKPVILFLGIFIILQPVFSQSSKKYPVHFPLFFMAYPLINPASSGSQDSFMDFRSGNLGNAGPFKEIRTLYANGSVLIRKKNQYKHVAGLTFYNDKEGDPIQRTRFYGNYALHISLTSRTYLSSGVSFGLVNYSFQGSSSYSTGSDSNYDGSAGIWLYSDNYHAGISLNQIFNRKLIPINEVFILAPYLSITGSRKIKIDKTLSLNPHFLLNCFNKNYCQVDLAMLVILGNHFSIGGSYRSGRGMSWIAGISDIPLMKNKIEIYFSYFSPIFITKRINVNSYQISLNYLLKKQKAGTESE
jgi:type IX secretion system PorP/SprF family membrane protein